MNKWLETYKCDKQISISDYLRAYIMGTSQIIMDLKLKEREEKNGTTNQNTKTY